MHMDYNFVVFGYDNGFYRTVLSDIMGLNSVIYRDLWGTKNKIAAMIYKLYFTPRLPNRHFPFKNLLYHAACDFHFADNRPICFLSFGRNFHDRTYPFLSYLKQHYPNAKFALYYEDLVETHRHDIGWVKQNFDLVLSYDYNDAKRYDILYYPTPYSAIPVESVTNPDNDVYFLGKGKNRLTEIIDAYERFTQNGLKCDFNLVGVPDKQQVYKNDIHYIKSMSYQENLFRASQSKCLLEILQKNARGYTFRMWEAILLGKKIITNNPIVRYSPFFDERYISIFTDTKKLDTDFVRANPDLKIDYHYIDQLSPRHLLEFITARLNETV